MTMAEPELEGRVTSLPERLAYAAYGFGSNFVGMAVLSLFPVFCTDELGISPAALAALLLAVRVWDAAFDPVFGGLADRIRFRSGRFKPWLAVSAWALPLACALPFLNPGGRIALAWAAAAYAACGMVQTMATVPHSALALTIGAGRREREGLLSLASFAGIAASAMAGMAYGPAAKALGARATVLSFAGASLIFMAPLGFLVKERRAGGTGSPGGLAAMLRALVGNKRLMAVNAAALFLNASSFALSAGTYFVKWNLGDLSLMAPVMACTFIPIAAIPLALPAILKRIDKRRLAMAGLAAAMILSFIQWRLGYASLPLFLAVNAVKTAGIYLPIIMMGMFTADCVDSGGRGDAPIQGGLGYALGALTGKVGAAISGAVAVFSLSISGYDGKAAEQSAAALEGIWRLLSLAPVAGLLPAFLVFALAYREGPSR